MEILNRAPIISEDTLQYKLYPPPEEADRASVTSLAARIVSFVESLLPDHIWHRDAFELKVIAYPEMKDKWMLEGLMRVGDSVDDEWCVVWLLREISKKWDVAISVSDSDGEFLFIEAADFLPRWVTPINVMNRVWIYRSHLHLIPLSYLSPPSTRPKHSRHTELNDGDADILENEVDDDEWLNAQDALTALRSRELTDAPTEVEEAVWKRISGYPDAAQHHVHIAKAFLPVDIAKALSQNPALIQRAVETFYTRDAIQLRAVHRMSRFPPKPDVLTPVRMTRTAFAQLIGQKFHPPKLFGQFKEREDSKEWRWRDIGMKIACGFEMSYQESRSRSEGITPDSLKVSADARKEALRRNPEYNEFIKKLEQSGYFKDELQGSRLWNDLEDKAAEIFVDSKREDDTARPSFAFLVNAAIAKAGDVVFVPNLEEQSDDWLIVDAESFEQKLTESMRPGAMRAKDKVSDVDAMDVDKFAQENDEESSLAKTQAQKLQGLAKKIGRFVKGEGSMEGAVFEDEKMSEDEDGDEDGQLTDFSEEDISGSEDEQPQIVEAEDPAAKAARQEAMERLVPGIDRGDYGKMPASYYTTSQRVAPVTMETEVREDISSAGKEAEGPKKMPIRRPILPRDNFDGVDSDDETDEDIDEESDEEKPQVVGELEIDMNEEQEDFVRFSREALGITDDMWRDIIRDRESRGAFVPSGIDKKQRINKEANRSSNTTSTPKAGSNSGLHLRSPQPGPRPNINPNLDSFEVVMEAMEAELQNARLKKGTGPERQHTSTKQVANRKGKERALASEAQGSDEEDIEAAMDAELRAALEREEGESGDEEPMNYALIKNFLESFKSQAGLSGPVSSLAGRLEPGWKLPRDDS